MTAAEVKAARLALGLTQAQLAAKLGIHPMLVSKWERGVHAPPPFLALALKQLRQE